MTTLDSLLADTDMLAVGSVPINSPDPALADSDNKAVLFVRDGENGRSLYLSLALYGEIARMYELDYSAWENTVLKMMTDVATANMGDNK